MILQKFELFDNLVNSKDELEINMDSNSFGIENLRKNHISLSKGTLTLEILMNGTEQYPGI